MKTRIRCPWKAKCCILAIGILQTWYLTNNIHSPFVPIWPLLRCYTVKPNPSYLQKRGRLVKTGTPPPQKKKRKKKPSLIKYTQKVSTNPLLQLIFHTGTGHTCSLTYILRVCVQKQVLFAVNLSIVMESVIKLTIFTTIIYHCLGSFSDVTGKDY